MTYITYNTNGGVVQDLNHPYFNIVNQINETEEFAQALENEDLNTYYRLLADYVGHPQIPEGEAIPQEDDQFLIYKKVMNFFILCDIDVLEFLTDELPECLFYGCEFVTNVRIPEGITSIGNYAFAFNPYLTSVELPRSCGKLGVYPFVFTGIRTLSLSDEFLRTPDSFQATSFAGCQIRPKTVNGRQIPNVRMSRELENLMASL